ncbi:MAG: hypothetical protein JWR26_2016 [Pedosphaera sp.]|nr:hypothetical protein [Pedosphaera sp.]
MQTQFGEAATTGFGAARVMYFTSRLDSELSLHQFVMPMTSCQSRTVGLSCSAMRPQESTAQKRDGMMRNLLWPDKSPEPTAVGAAARPECFRGSAVAVHAASRR